MHCLPRKGDSTYFRLAFILDSLATRPSGAVAVIRSPRRKQPPGFINQVVSVDFQAAGSTRIQGTACPHDAGVVCRDNAHTFNEGILYLDAAGQLDITVYDGQGKTLAPHVGLAPGREGTRLEWRTPAT